MSSRNAIHPIANGDDEGDGDTDPQELYSRFRIGHLERKVKEHDRDLKEIKSDMTAIKVDVGKMGASVKAWLAGATGAIAIIEILSKVLAK